MNSDGVGAIRQRHHRRPLDHRFSRENRNVGNVVVFTEAERVSEPSTEITEDIEVVLTPIEKIGALIMSGELRDVGSLAAFAWARATLPNLGWDGS